MLWAGIFCHALRVLFSNTAEHIITQLGNAFALALRTAARVGLSGEFESGSGLGGEPTRSNGVFYTCMGYRSVTPHRLFDTRHADCSDKTNSRMLSWTDHGSRQSRCGGNPWLLKLTRVTLNPIINLCGSGKKGRFGNNEALRCADCLGENKELGEGLRKQYQELLSAE